MTGWINIAFISDAEEETLKQVFDSRYEDRLIEAEPPTIMMGHLEDRERENLAKKLLSDFDTVETIVMVSNSDTGDWATGYIYTVPDDYRDIDCEKISGRSGSKGYDVKGELEDRGYYITISHRTYTLDAKDFAHLWRDNNS